jgi:DNA-binding NarL/FixJ family response regulator
VLVLGLYAEDRVALRMLKAGARGYVEKQDAPGELVPAIQRVAEGGHYIGSALADRLSRDLAAARPPRSR